MTTIKIPEISAKTYAEINGLSREKVNDMFSERLALSQDWCIAKRWCKRWAYLVGKFKSSRKASK